MAEEISYKLEQFEGPLDLLLHLIEKNKINIYDIPIIEITKQYLEYMSHMETEDLSIVSDFLVMAATLLDIKAKMLLPAEVDEETGQEIDPRAELVERLLQHKKYKLLAKELADGEFDAEHRFYKNPTIPKEVAGYMPPPDLDAMFDGVTLAKLKSVFDAVMKRKVDSIDIQRSQFGTIKKEPISLKDRIVSMVGYARQHKRFSFRNLLESQPTKVEVVVTFLAILELMKIGQIHLEQESLFDDMTIDYIGSDDDTDIENIEGLEELSDE